MVTCICLHVCIFFYLVCPAPKTARVRVVRARFPRSGVMYNGLADLRGKKSRLDFRRCFPSSFFLFFILFCSSLFARRACVCVFADVASYLDFLSFPSLLLFGFDIMCYSFLFSYLKRVPSKNVRAIRYLQGSICSFIIYAKMERQLMSGEC